MKRTITSLGTLLPALLAGVFAAAGWTASAQCSLRAGKNAAACQIAPADASGAKKAQTTCPVMGGKIDKKFYADYKGKRVYFCCPDCIKAFKADPAKYVKKLEASGVVLDKAVKGKPQRTCPVMGGKIDKKFYADYKGKRVYFCCPACIKAFKADPAKYVRKLEASGVVLDKAVKGKPQRTCPVMGGKIDKKFYADYKGKRVYFCCPDCIKAFKADPAKYVKKLDASGVVPDKAPRSR